ncbi:hypothetical protein KIPB_014188 [Kipferlia bialata]|uniref:Uncharacterized protein n=1 Tax=Kipferlia bialata TaxID=797122 RepID=A0A391P246_9EUKA|nr:hypothetical protein KIPB_014188 [Kipferlia bialata]|eukprot:g14188.t1
MDTKPEGTGVGSKVAQKPSVSEKEDKGFDELWNEFLATLEREYEASHMLNRLTDIHSHIHPLCVALKARAELVQGLIRRKDKVALRKVLGPRVTGDAEMARLSGSLGM